MLSKDFKEFAELLNSNRVEYLIVKTNKHAVGRHKDLADIEQLGEDPAAES